MSQPEPTSLKHFGGFSNSDLFYIDQVHNLKTHSRVWDSFWQIEIPLKKMRKFFNFMIKAVFVLKMFTFFSWLFGYVEKRLDRNVKVNSRVHDVTKWTTNNMRIICQEKNVSHVIICKLIKFHCLLAFTSWDIEKYMYCTYLLSSLWRHKLWN